MNRVNHDSGDLIWFDFNDANAPGDFDKLKLSNFDITNMPVKATGRDFIGNTVYSPLHFSLNNYMTCFFEDAKSKTGYSCMCINRDKQIYKLKLGYTNGKPSANTY